MKVKDICLYLDSVIPLLYQESYDNSGLQSGDPESEISSALLALDVTEAVVEEASFKNCGLIITHHPVIFHPLKSLSGKSQSEKIIIKALKENIAIYSSHTCLDVFTENVSKKMAEKLSLTNLEILSPLENTLLKLVTFVPEDYAEKVRDAIFNAGAGVIGNYDMCSFNAEGYGTFRGNESSNPFLGERGKLYRGKEVRIETILPLHLKDKVIKSMLAVHPYEEVAYDIYPLAISNPQRGLGCIGELTYPLKEKEFINMLARAFDVQIIRYSSPSDIKVRKVALCGGAGASLTNVAVGAGANAFVTSDLKYHDFFNAGDNILLADIGHYESEIFSLEILYNIIKKKFINFALQFSEIKTSPIKYYYNGKVKSTG